MVLMPTFSLVNNRTMELSILLLEDFPYTSVGSSLPFLYQVKFESAVVLHGPIHVTACLLTNDENDDVCIGYTKNIFALPGVTLAIPSERELVLAVDALEYENEPSEFTSGRYELSAKVQMQVQVAGGSVCHQELRSSCHIDLL